MNKYPYMASLVMRLSIGGMMLTHGYGKFMNLISGNTGFADPIGIGQTLSLVLTVFAEFICSILIIIGLKTRLAVISPIIVMLVAVFIVHGNDPWKQKELGLIYLAGYIAIYLLNSGKYSLDWVLKKV